MCYTSYTYITHICNKGIQQQYTQSSLPLGSVFVFVFFFHLSGEGGGIFYCFVIHVVVISSLRKDFFFLCDRVILKQTFFEVVPKT